MDSSSFIPTTDGLSTELPRLNTTFETSTFQPRPVGVLPSLNTTFETSTFQPRPVAVLPSLNTTFEKSTFQPLPVSVYIVWFILGITGNITALGVLYYNRRHHLWAIFYQLVFLVTLSDFIGQLITIPIMFATFANSDVLVTGGKLCDFMSVVTIMSTLISIFLVCLMSLDRLLALWYPIFYKYRIRSKHRRITVTLTIVIATVISNLPTVGINRHKLQKQGTWCFFDLHPAEQKDRVFLYLCASIGIAAILSMLIMNSFVLYGLHQVYRRKMPNESKRWDTRNTPDSGVRQVKSICFLITVMAAFMFSWIPLTISFIHNVVAWPVIDHDMDRVSLALAIMHQILNPWIYIIMQDKVFLCCLRYARNHSKAGNIFDRILEKNSEVKQQESTDEYGLEINNKC